MFSGVAYEVPLQTGKKMLGTPNRKEGSFSLGWDSNSHMNDFQIKKSKNKEITGKITTQNIIQGQEVIPQRNSYEPQAKDFERIFQENPNMSQQELQKIMLQYEKYRGTPSRKSQSGSVMGESEQRVPIRPRESMKDILYSGVGVGQEMGGRTGSRVGHSLQSEIIIAQDLKAIIIIKEFDLSTHIINFDIPYLPYSSQDHINLTQKSIMSLIYHPQQHILFILNLNHVLKTSYL